MSDPAMVCPEGWVLIENEGALFRGPGRANPMEVWTSAGWQTFAQDNLSRGVEWGNLISEADAGKLTNQYE
jgi:hypothetical protein